MIACYQDVLGFEVTVKHLVVVNVLKPERQLNEPIEDLPLWEAFVALLCLLDSSLKVTPLTVIHDDTDVVFFYEAVVVSYDICMGQALQDFDLQMRAAVM